MQRNLVFYSALSSALAGSVMTVYLVATLWVRVPIADMWAFLERLVADQGRLTLSHWLAPHNEHLIGVAKLLYMADLTWNAGRGSWLVIIALLTQGLHVALWTWAFHRLAGWRGRQLVTTGAIVALFVFHPAQIDNLAVPFQVHIPLSLLFASAAFISYSLGTKPAATACTVMLGLLAMFSWGIGFLVFPILTVGALWQRRRVAFLYALLSLLPLPLLPQTPHPMPALAGMARYALAYLSSPLWTYGPRAIVLLSILLIAAIVYLSAKTWPLPAARPLIMLSALVLGSSLLTGIARASFGWQQGVSSRYCAVAVFAWMAVLFLAELADIRWRHLAMTATLLLFAIPLTYPQHAFGPPVNMMRDAAYYRQVLLEHRSDEALARRLNSAPSKQTLEWLEQHHLSVFAP